MASPGHVPVSVKNPTTITSPAGRSLLETIRKYTGLWSAWTSKTHLVSAIGHELILKGHSVFFTPVYRLVQNLLAAKRELKLDKEMRRLDRFERSS